MYIYFSKLQSQFEKEYIFQYLLKEVRVERIFTCLDEIKDFKEKIDEITIVFSGSKEETPITEEVNKLITEVETYNLIHLSDEGLVHNTKIYKNAKKVLRAYYKPNLTKNNVITIPIGLQGGYINKDNIDKDIEKIYTWSFFGQAYSERSEMLNKLLELGPNLYHTNSSFLSNDMLSATVTKYAYLKTHFSLCPFGFLNPDSFRILETLENGCIPVVKKFVFIDYYKYIYGDHPFILVNDWDEAVEKLKDFISNDEKLLQKHHEVREWYKSYKINLQKSVKTYLLNKNYFLNSQFKYQKNGKLNLLVLITFFYWFKIRTNYKFIFVQKKIYKFKQFIKKNLNL